MNQSWSQWLKNEFSQPYFLSLSRFVAQAYDTTVVYPPRQLVFSAFNSCSYEDIKVVILGQDPYHQPYQAHGMCFSVNPGVAIPKSLLNIYKEIGNEYGYPMPNNGYLMPWAKQGVFLLNAVLTVEEGKPRSHANKGWEIFTDHVIAHINEKQDPVVFMLWGNDAKAKASMVDQSRHLVLMTTHPSPLSAHAGFLGCGHFRKANEFLRQKGRSEIDWQIKDL